VLLTAEVGFRLYTAFSAATHLRKFADNKTHRTGTLARAPPLNRCITCLDTYSPGYSKKDEKGTYPNVLSSYITSTPHATVPVGPPPPLCQRYNQQHTAHRDQVPRLFATLVYDGVLLVKQIAGWLRGRDVPFSFPWVSCVSECG
jgi:hypothetical protein